MQAVSEEYCTRRRQFKKAKLRWRVSHGSKRALGWIPVKAMALRYKNGQVHYQGVPTSLWDSFGLKDFTLRLGGFCEDSRGRDTNAAKNILARGWALMADLGFCQIAIAGEARAVESAMNEGMGAKAPSPGPDMALWRQESPSTLLQAIWKGRMSSRQHCHSVHCLPLSLGVNPLGKFPMVIGDELAILKHITTRM